jgi:hypothetical protein
MAIIERLFTPGTSIAAVSAATTTSPRFPFGRFAGGGVIIGNTGGATQINWHAATGHESTPVQIFADGSAVTSAVTVGAIPIPDACFGFPWIAPIVSSGGTTTVSMNVCVKG